MTFNELGENLKKYLSRKIFHEQKYAEDAAQLAEKFKGDFLNSQLAERKATLDSTLYALKSSLKADIKAVHDEKIKLAEVAAGTAPTTDMMNLLQALSLRKSISKSDVLAVAEAVQGNYHALAVLRDVAKDKGYNIDIIDIDQTKQQIESVCDLAEQAVNGTLDALTMATLGDRDYKIAQYNEAEKRGDFVMCQTIQTQIQSGISEWDNMTQELDNGFVRTPEPVRILSPGEEKLVGRMFDGVPADNLKDAVNQKANESPEARGLIELSDFASLLDPDDAA